MASKSKIIAELFEADGDIIVSALDNVTPAAVSDAANTSTGSFSVPKGTAAQQPASASAGQVRFDTNKGVLTYADGTNWYKVSGQTPTVSSVSGFIWDGYASTITLTGTNFFSDSITVNFTQSDDSIDANVTVTASSDTAATVAVPSAVYSNVTAGRVVSITVTNSDALTSNPNTSTTASSISTGGTVSNTGNYVVHTFTSSGNFVVPTGQTISGIEYVVVAGGGGGEGTTACCVGHGGGGAGGYRSSVSGESSGGGASAEATLTRNAGTYTVTIGAGGTGANNGSNSAFDTITSIGGGYGGHYTGSGIAPTSGGSGGGAIPFGGSSTLTGASGTSGQGYAGGSAGGSTNSMIGGGGGGAGAVGANGGDSGGTGGVGVQTSITGSATYYAGGGGGAVRHNYGSNTSGAAGGNGGGGTGVAKDGNGGTNGSANTGGGAGGGAGGSSTSNLTGGSGIVIVRYQLANIS